MLDKITHLSGFDSAELQMLSDKDASALKRNNALSFAGIFLCGVSIAYLVGFCTNSWLLAISAGITLVAVMLALQMLALTSTGYDLNNDLTKLSKWRPSLWRVLIFLLISLISSQPLLLFFYEKTNSGEIKQSIFSEKLLHKEFLENSLKNQEDLLLLEVAKQSEQLNQLHATNQLMDGKSTSLAKSRQHFSKDKVLADPRRKALVIGNQSYPLSPLNNPLKDATDLTDKLENMGFNVTLLENGTRQDMEITLEKYIKSLKAGDVSVLYYSGHGFQDHGFNYLVPVDFTDFVRSKAVGLNLAIDSISRRSPLANVVIIDACRTFSMNSSGGLAATEAGLNTYIALASKPGQVAEDGAPGTNGIFTSSILKNIASPIDIDTIFREVRKEVAEKSGNKQETWTAHNLSGRLILTSPDRMVSGEGQTNTEVELDAKKDQRLSFCETATAQMSGVVKIQYIEQCSKARIMKLRDNLKEHTENTKLEIEKIDKSLENSNQGPAELLAIFYSFWSHPLFSILGTIIVSFILTYGFLCRDLFPTSLREIEKSRYTQNRNFISAQFERMNQVVEKLKHASKIRGETEIVSLFNDVATSELALSTATTDKKSYKALFTTLAKSPIGAIG